MEAQDLKVMAEIGRAIWWEPEIAERTVVETLMAAALQDPEPERLVERVGKALLERSSRQGTASLTRNNFSQLGAPFYRLEHERRFLLSVVHLGKWSYERIGRVLNVSREQVEELLWSARLELAALGVTGKESGVFPAGAKAATQSCPEYDSRKPWTQRFLDEELAGGSERLFLQTHLMACESCKQALGRCREVYFSVEAQIPRFPEDPRVVRSLAAVYEKARALRFPTQRSFADTLRIFIARREVQLALAGLVVLALVKAFN